MSREARRTTIESKLNLCFLNPSQNHGKQPATQKNFSVLFEIMTGPQQQQRELSLNKYFLAINNKHGVRHDLEALCKFVRETLFYAMIHDARGNMTNPNDEIMGENGKACKIFVHVFLQSKEKISNTELIESTDEEKEHYLKFLWKEGLRTKGRYNIRKALSNEKSAVYAGIAESFKSKYGVGSHV